MHRLFVPLPNSVLEELGRQARLEHRRPPDHAAYLLERALCGGTAPADSEDCAATPGAAPPARQTGDGDAPTAA